METQPEKEPVTQWRWYERVVLLWDRAAVRWLVVLVCAGLAFAVVLATRSMPEQQAMSKIDMTGRPMSSSSPAASQLGSATTTAKPSTVVVDVTGSVRKPGIIELPSGSRVADAIEAAGGLARGRAGVNLARLLVDGEQIVVGAGVGAAVGGVGASAPSQSESSPANNAAEKVHLNTATATELEALPRIGPVTAAKIIEYRNEHGGFRSVDQLRDVSGVGDVTFAGVAPLVEP